MKKQYLEIGKIVATYGIHGEIRVQPWCDAPADLAEQKRLYLDDKGKKSVIVLRGRIHKNIVVLLLEGISTVEEAQLLRNQILYVDRDTLSLEEGAYFIQDLIGLVVSDADDPAKVYGRLTDVFQTGANDVYEITDENGTKRLIPAIKEVVISTDIEGEKMKIRPLKGLFEDED